MLTRPKLWWSNRVLLLVAAGVVYPQVGLAQRPAATLIEMTGQVSVLQDGAQKALFVGKSVSAREVIVTGPDSYAKFQLADHSVFEVFERSHVIFNEDWPGNLTHMLNVWLGKIRVLVDHSNGPNHQQVTTPTAVISVRGTVFDVAVEDSDGTTAVTVEEGLVQVRGTTVPGGEPLLHPGDSIRVFRNQPLIGQQIDKSGIVQRAFQAAREAAYQVLLGRSGSVGPIPGGAGGAPQPSSPGAGQGDSGKKTNPPPPPPPGSGGH